MKERKEKRAAQIVALISVVALSYLAAQLMQAVSRSDQIGIGPFFYGMWVVIQLIVVLVGYVIYNIAGGL